MQIHIDLKSRRKILITILCVAIIFWGFYVFYFGVVMAPDSYTYSNWADILIANNFNINAYQKTLADVPTSSLYLGFVSLVAAAKLIAGSFWPQFIMIINVILGALLGIMLADLVYVFTKNKFCVYVTLVLYVFNPEIILWSRYVLSDISFIFLNFLAFYLIAKAFFQKDKKRTFYWILAFFIFIVSFFYRATGIMMAPIILFAFFLNSWKRQIRWKAVIPAFVLFVPVLVCIHATVIKNIWALQPGKSILKDFAVFLYQNGIVVHDRLYTYHLAPTTLWDYIFITADKFIHYFYFSDRLFSLTHKLINYLFFVPTYVLFILGIIASVDKRIHFNIKSLVAIAIAVIIAFSLFHSMTLIDFDWRYRLPILPYMLLISGLGMKMLLQNASSKINARV